MNFWSSHHHHHDETERRKWQDPEAILAEIGLRPGMTFIDIGCGSGFFAIPAARIAGNKGKVYGLDINADVIEGLRKKIQSENLPNVELQVGRAEETLLCTACADIVFFGIDLHDFESPEKVLLNARKMLKPDGKLIDVDWKKEPTPFGPPAHIRLSEEQASQLIEDAGFRVQSVRDPGLYQYLIMATI